MTEADRILLETLVERQHRSLLAALTQGDSLAFRTALEQFATDLSPLIERLQLQAAGRWSSTPHPPKRTLAGPKRTAFPVSSLVHTERFDMEGRRLSEKRTKPRILEPWNPGGRKPPAA